MIHLEDFSSCTYNKAFVLVLGCARFSSMGVHKQEVLWRGPVSKDTYVVIVPDVCKCNYENGHLCMPIY